MGAYSNPQIVVDTQSGQHWRNLQEQISRTIEKVGGSFAEAARRNREYGQIAEKNTQSVQTITSTLDISNPAFNISDAAKPLIDKYNKLQNDIAFGRSKDVAADREACSKMEGMIAETGVGIGNLASLAGKTKEWLKNQNKVNGMAPNNDPNAVNFAGILSNNIPGKVEVFYDLENYKTVFNAYEPEDKDENGNLKYKSKAFLSLPADKLKSYLDNNGGIKLIPPITPILDSLRSNPTMFNSKGELNEDFYKKDYREVSRNEKSLITNNKLDKNTYIVDQQPVLVPDESKIMPILRQNIEAQISGMEDISEIQALYNHYVCQESPVGLNEQLSPMQRAETADYLAKTFMNTVPTIDDKSSPAIKSQVTKQTEDTSSGGNNENDTKGKTPAQILNENLNSSYTTPGPPLKALSESKWVKVGKDGKLYKVDENEEKISKTHLSLKDARIYLGLPANGILTVKK